MLFSCSDNDIAQDTPSCVKKIIEDLKNGEVDNPPAKIYRYQYEGRTVYYIPAKCCDIPSVLLDDNCHSICSPDGGLGGAGNGTCTDFHKKATDQKLIWEDKRGK
ncbi:DUF6970 domain-containing protein [Dyadobacter chenhuakuii]|uniref:DUF6970 domain-containing protein n=1 Tax=Dyadobacter chenhuakuii TaxID=2909339 RepID=A0ABY5EA52_9BACT|nr:hypothetical protein [Dyadobacter chenhuakuii]UTM21795.1 hypothetical protein NFI80_25310 [Dyadobacter chenhuakuii]